MPYFISEPVQSDEQQLATLRHGDSEQSPEEQYHDLSANSVTMDEANEPEIQDVGTDISARQKMLSAVSGSLLTSLLGRLHNTERQKKSSDKSSHSDTLRCCPSSPPVTTKSFQFLPSQTLTTILQPPPEPRSHILLP